MEISEGIYENDEICIIEKTVKTTTTRNEQQPPNSGIITAGSRWHKLALVCQGLLCVFLLIVIIVLGIYTNLTAEKNQLKKDYYNLTVERNQLKKDYYNLTVKRNQLQMDNYNLTGVRDQLENENNESLKQLTVLEESCMYFNFSVYSITTEKKGWSFSRQDCKQRGADLLIINSKKEQILPSNLNGIHVHNVCLCRPADPTDLEQVFISRCFPNTSAWIGLNDVATEGKFMWVDGTALNTEFWWYGEPNNAGQTGNEDCVETSRLYNLLNNWNDVSCHYNLFGICERKLVAP